MRVSLVSREAFVLVLFVYLLFCFFTIQNNTPAVKAAGKSVGPPGPNMIPTDSIINTTLAVVFRAGSACVDVWNSTEYSNLE